MKMQEQIDELNTGRSYFWEALEYDFDIDMYVVHWGS